MTSETSRPERRARHRRRVLVAVGFVLGAVLSPLAASASGDAIGVAAVPDSEPPTEPTASSVPEATAPSTSAPSEEPAVESTREEGDATSPAALWIGVILATSLLGVAAWWMLRRTDDREPPSDPDWPDTSDVI